MPVRESVREAQLRLAALDANYARAEAKLKRASARRDELLAEQDRQLALAEEEVARTIAAMADAVGVQLTANLVGIETQEVRRLVKASRLPC